MSLDEKVRTIESYEIPGEERCCYFSTCRKNCDGYSMQDDCKRYKKHWIKEMAGLDKEYGKTSEGEER